jgi:hypothetical protein
MPPPIDRPRWPKRLRNNDFRAPGPGPKPSNLNAKLSQLGSETARRLYLSLYRLATDLDTEHAGTDANKRDEARQVGRLNVADVQL